MIEADYKSQINPKEGIEILLRRSPSGPDFGQPTLAYCNQAIDTSLSRVSEVLIKQHPTMATEISDKLKSISSPRSLPPTDIVIDNNRLSLRTPRGKAIPTILVVQAVHRAEPVLAAFHYAIAMYLPRNKKEAESQKYPWFNNRFRQILETGNFSIDDPMAQIIAIAYITQVAKNSGVDASKQLLKKGSVFGGVESSEKVLPYIQTLKSFIEPIRFDEAFIKKGLETITGLAQKANLDNDQVQLLLDLAFIRNRGFDKSQEFREALEPLIKLVAEGNWPQAYLHRYFLLKYFASSFPAWRIRDFQGQTGQESFKSFGQLAEAIANNQVLIDEDEVPPLYRNSFHAVIPKKVERAIRLKEAEIVQRSVDLSNTIVKELDRQTSILLVRKKLEDIFGEKTDYLLPQSLDEFFNQLEEVKPDMLTQDAEEFYKSIKGLIQRISTENPQSPFKLRDPQPVSILYVGLKDNDQFYWYPLKQPREVVDREGNVSILFNYFGNFSELLYRVIQASFQQSEGRPILDGKTLKTTLEQAYEKEARRNPQIRQFTLPEYLTALINRSRSGKLMPETDPVRKFIETMKS